MEEKYYTVDQIAEILDMHPKTIRRFIREGKLRANKVGKQWRITGNDLSLFTEGNKMTVTQATKERSDEIFTIKESIDTNQKVKVSAVIDILVEDRDEQMRIANTLLAVMNSKDPKYGNSTINIQYLDRDKKLRIMLWGTVFVVETMLSSISVLIDQSD